MSTFSNTKISRDTVKQYELKIFKSVPNPGHRKTV